MRLIDSRFLTEKTKILWEENIFILGLTSSLQTVGWIFCPKQKLKILCKVLVTQSFLTSVSPWTEACQAPLSMEFSRQEYWGGLAIPFSNYVKGNYISYIEAAEIIYNRNRSFQEGKCWNFQMHIIKIVFTILKEIGENSFGRKYKTKESVIVKIKKN